MSITIPTTHGALKLPFMTRGKFIIPTTCGFATHGRNYTVPTPSPEGIEALPGGAPLAMVIDIDGFIIVVVAAATPTTT